MLVICEECAKKYNIDETRIKGEKAQFSCRECGHIIVVKKPVVVENNELSDEEAMAQLAAMPSPENFGDSELPNPSVTTGKTSLDSEKKAMSVGTYIVLLMTTGFVVISGTILYLLAIYLPGIINNPEITDTVWKALLLPFSLTLIGAAILIGFVFPLLLAQQKLKKY